uniref:Uncharacterized protein n=1 Tax=Sphaerodactylus townsendi TaxID=933632 RepID=A0ACB8EFY2_9SAUR
MPEYNFSEAKQDSSGMVKMQEVNKEGRLETILLDGDQGWESEKESFLPERQKQANTIRKIHVWTQKLQDDHVGNTTA